ncbi:Arc family DNA-binding protein [Agrobacterium vitis]|uniref:Arc family DNA-binding protein n=1 Tax=Agrobacterium vitis TaxID=373 RepID=UPI0012E82706|nr:Arc family DNA-binding protein [Agrobacterium vitis]MVA36115.1 Arc family DNA-binding protein [Agrobacterium vitis]
MSSKKPDIDKVSNVPPFGLRMLPDLKERVASEAAKNGRSMNAEIISRLEAAYADEAEDKTVLRIKLTHDVRVKLNQASGLFKSNLEEVAQEILSRDASQITEHTSKLLEEHKKKEKELFERELYWMNIAMALNGIRRTQLSLFKFAMQHVTAFKGKIPSELLSYCQNLFNIYKKELDDLPEDEKSVKFLKDQAEDAHKLVYVELDGSDDADFIVDPPKNDKTPT